MMKRLKLAIRILFGLPLRGVRIDETMMLDYAEQSVTDYTEHAPFDLVFGDVVTDGPPVGIHQEERFRICVFREKWKGEGCGCGKAPHWLVLELRGDEKWHHLMTMHESRLSLMLGTLQELQRNLDAERGYPRALPRVTFFDKEYFVDARLQELRNVNNPHDRLAFQPVEYVDW